MESTLAFVVRSWLASQRDLLSTVGSVCGALLLLLEESLEVLQSCFKTRYYYKHSGLVKLEFLLPYGLHVAHWGSPLRPLSLALTLMALGFWSMQPLCFCCCRWMTPSSLPLVYLSWFCSTPKPLGSRLGSALVSCSMLQYASGCLLKQPGPGVPILCFPSLWFMSVRQTWLPFFLPVSGYLSLYFLSFFVVLFACLS